MLRGLPATFRWLLAGAFLSALATFVMPFMALFLAARGEPPGRIGLTVGLFGAGAAFAAPLWGTLADRWGRRPALATALGLAAVITAAIPFVDSPALLAAAMAALGLSAQGYRPVLSAVVADVVPPEEQLRAYGLVSWALNVGVGVALVAGGALAERGYLRLFLLDALTTALFAGLVLWRVPETRPASAARAGGPGWGALRGDRVTLLLLGLAVLLVVPFAQFSAALPLAMAAHGLGPRGFGLTMAVNCGLIGLLQPSVTRATAGLDPSRRLAGATVFVGAGYGAYALCGPGWSWALATAVWTGGEILLFPTMEALLSALAPEAVRGRYLGSVSAAYAAGFAFSPVVGGAVLEAAGAPALWLGCLAMALAAGVGFVALGPACRRAVAVRRGLPA